MKRVQPLQAMSFPLEASRRYDRLAKFFHWAVFLLVAAAYAAIELKGFFPKGAPARSLAMSVHEWAGMLVLVLAVPRLLWRLVRGAPAPEPGPRWMHWAGEAMHWVLYAFILAQPVLGLLTVNAGGHLLTLPVLGIDLPAVVGTDPGLKDLLKELHETIGTAFYLVIGLHAMAALFHHYMLGDNTLRRIWR
jgi:cytochrome b561